MFELSFTFANIVMLIGEYHIVMISVYSLTEISLLKVRLEVQNDLQDRKAGRF